MVLMKYFCFYFPVRLGVVVTSCVSVIEVLINLIYFLMTTATDFKNMVRNIQKNLYEYSSNDVFVKCLELAESCKTILKYVDGIKIICSMKLQIRMSFAWQL